jgi:cell division protein FtsL
MAENIYKTKKRGGSFWSFLNKKGETEDVKILKSPTFYVPHLLFLTLLGIIYIANAHYAEKTVRETSKMEAEVENLRADYTTIRAEYDNYVGKQSVIAEKAKKLGLQESKGKVQKIIVKKGEY